LSNFELLGSLLQEGRESIATILFFKPYQDTTRKRGFSEGQLDRSVHINLKVCPFWLKVWGMKKTCYVWLKWPLWPSAKPKIWSKWTNVHQNGHGLIKLAILNGWGFVNWSLWFNTYLNEPYSFHDLANLLSLGYLLLLY